MDVTIKITAFCGFMLKFVSGCRAVWTDMGSSFISGHSVWSGKWSCKFSQRNLRECCFEKLRKHSNILISCG